MKKKLKIISFAIISILFSLQFINCTNNKKNLNIILENPKKSDKEFIEILIKNYNKKNKNLNINLKTSNDFDESINLLNANNYDVIICPRNSMLELCTKGLLRDISNVYETSRANSRFYNIVCSYGRYNNKYYGLGLMPYSIDLLVNKDILLEKSYRGEFFSVENIDKSIKNNYLYNICGNYIEPNLALASFVGNNLIMETILEKNFLVNYYNIKEVQNIFDNFNYFVKLFKNKLIIKSDYNIIDKIKSKEIPLLFSTSLELKNINKSNKIKAIGNILYDKYKISSPVVVDHNICVLQNGKNHQEINKFIDYMFEDEIYIDLAKQGFVSGNMVGVAYVNNAQKDILWSISLATENNIPFYLNLPNKMQKFIIEEIKNIYNGQYDGDEWKRIVEKFNM